MDALLLSVYFLVVFYVLYQMALTLERNREERVVITLDNEFAAAQVQEQLSQQSGTRHIKAFARTIGFGKGKDGRPRPKKPVVFIVFDTNKTVPLTSPDLVPLRLLGMSEEAAQEALQPKVIIEISKPLGKAKLKPPIPFITISVKNDTIGRQVYIYWDRSSLAIFGQGNRIIRSTPNIPIDFTQSQTFSVVNPGQRVVSNLSTEKNYARNPETNQLARVQPLFDLEQRVEMSKTTDPTKKSKNEQILGGLDLMIGLKHTTEADSRMLNLLVPLSLEMEIKVDKIAFPPLRYISRKIYERKEKREGSWIAGQQKGG